MSSQTITLRLALAASHTFHWDEMTALKIYALTALTPHQPHPIYQSPSAQNAQYLQCNQHPDPHQNGGASHWWIGNKTHKNAGTRGRNRTGQLFHV